MLLVFAAAVAMVVANSPASVYYDRLLELPLVIRIGDFGIAKPLLMWINDGLMAIFFFLVGLELKREVLEGELSDRGSILLPLFGALGGILVPVTIYILINRGDAEAMSGWAIPAATDIAFALGILALFGNRVPTALKVLLVSIAIFDDVAAIVIIAIFYSGNLSFSAIAVSLVCLGVLAVMNRRGVLATSTYCWVGLILWVALLKSGVHATLAGVAVAAFIPLRVPDDSGRSPLRELESDLHHLVAFAILPVFAFANAGVSMGHMGPADFLHPVSIGVATGLFVGKQLGVFGFCWLAIRLGIAKIPGGATIAHLYGVSALCGIGFTMSMFIGSLAFENNPGQLQMVFDERIGIIAGSILSAGLACLILNATLPRPEKDA